MMNHSRNRTKLVYLNIFITLGTQVLQILLGFAVRKIFIITLGVTYLGYNSVFDNILQMLNLADMGIGVAITSFLYKPLAENDNEKINSLMYIYKKIYRLLSIAVLGLGIIISFFLPAIIRDATCSFTYLRILFYINLAGTVSTYYLAYKRTLLIADQKTYIASFVDTSVYLLASIIQIILLFLWPNYIVYLIITVAKNIGSNIVLSVKCSKEYKCLDDPVNKSVVRDYKKSIIRYVKDIFLSRLGACVYYSTDNIIISVFKGSLLTGYLSNYIMVTTQINNLITRMLSSLQATFGNYIHTEESIEKQEAMTKNYLCIVYFIGNFCMVCILSLIQPFIHLFFGAQYVLSFSTATWIAINLMMTIMIQLPSQLFIIYKLYYYDKVIVAVSAALNLVFSVLLVQPLGIDGVLIGTFVTSQIYLFSRFAIVCRKIYKTQYSDYVLMILRYYTISAVTIGVVWVSTNWITDCTIRSFLFRLVIVGVEALVIPAAILLGTKEFQFALRKFVPKKIKNIFIGIR